MKKCPFCAEQDLQEDAKICKHCGRNISEAEKPFYTRKIGCAPILGVIFIIAGFVSGPFWWILAVLLFILVAVNKK